MNTYKIFEGPRETRDWFELIASALLIWLLGYVILALPWFQQVDCLRSGPLELRLLHIFSDAAFFTAYSWIPFRLVLLWLGIEIRPGGRLLILYGLFIVLCGLVHLGLILVFWWPYYWLLGKLKACGGAIVAYVTECRKHDLRGLSRQGAELRAATDRAERLQREAEDRAERLEAAQKEVLERASSEEAARKQAEGLALDLKNAVAERDSEIAKNATLLAELNIAKDQAIQRAQRAEGTIGIAEAARDDAQKYADDLRMLNERLELALREGQAASERIDLQAAAIQELEIPVVPLWTGVLLLPLVGPMDSTRAGRLTEGLLGAVITHSARFVILDLTGVRVVDTAVAGALTMTAKAVKLVGSECVITGISGDIAMTVVKLGLEFGIVTLRDVQQGLALAMRRIAPS